MTSGGWVALAITVVAAFGYAAASILQAVGARRSPSAAAALRHPLYVIGATVDILAWAGSMVALRELAVYLVESVLAFSLALTVLFARFFLKSRLRARDVLAVMVSIVALTVLAMSAGPQEIVTPSNDLRIWLCAAAALLAVLGRLGTRYASPGVVGGIAGLALGGAALVGRVYVLPEGNVLLGIVTEPLTAALLLFAAVGMTLYADALQRGSVGAVTAVLWIAEVTAPSAVALAFLGDSVRPGWDWTALGAGLVIVAMAVLLATAPASVEVAAVEAGGDQAQGERLTLPAGLALGLTGEKYIWWGPAPIWTPPDRPDAEPAGQARNAEPAAVTAANRRALTWHPPQAVVPFVGPLRPDAYADVKEPDFAEASPRVSGHDKIMWPVWQTMPEDEPAVRPWSWDAR
jgi:hypothetical protein